jgi:hypothetical protein
VINPAYEYERISDFYQAMDEILTWSEPRLLFKQSNISKWGRVSQVAFQRMENISPSLPENSYFLSHPILGPGNARMWLKMIRIHAEHHLEIIHEIDAAF